MAARPDPFDFGGLAPEPPVITRVSPPEQPLGRLFARMRMAGPPTRCARPDDIDLRYQQLLGELSASS